jgi:hypothetical protein
MLPPGFFRQRAWGGEEIMKVDIEALISNLDL